MTLNELKAKVAAQALQDGIVATDIEFFLAVPCKEDGCENPALGEDGYLGYCGTCYESFIDWCRENS